MDESKLDQPFLPLPSPDIHSIDVNEANAVVGLSANNDPLTRYLNHLETIHLFDDDSSIIARRYRLCHWLLIIGSAGIAAISIIILIQPNLDAGTIVAHTLDAPGGIAPFIRFLLVIGACGSNLIFNAYCTYMVCMELSASWLLYPSQPTWKEILLDVFSTILRAIPVLLSTSQVIGLASESDLSPFMLVSQIVVYTFLHWFAITGFVQGWLQSITLWAKKRFGGGGTSKCQSPPTNYHATESMSNEGSNNDANLMDEEYLEKLRSKYLNSIDNAIKNLRHHGGISNSATAAHSVQVQMAQESVPFQKINLSPSTYSPPSPSSSSASSTSSTSTSSLTRPSIRSDPTQPRIWLKQILSIDSTEVDKPNVTVPVADLPPWFCLLPFDLLTACLIKLCYIGMDLSVWNHSRSWCRSFTQSSEICDNTAFVSTLTLIALFPLSYLMMVIVAPTNVRAIWRMTHPSAYGSTPVMVQAYPRLVWSIRILLMLLSLVSFGTCIRLNSSYIQDFNLLAIANTNSILLNSFFNAFPIPAVSIALAQGMVQFYQRFRTNQPMPSTTRLSSVTSIVSHDLTRQQPPRLPAFGDSTTDLVLLLSLETVLTDSIWLIRRAPKPAWAQYVRSNSLLR